MAHNDSTNASSSQKQSMEPTNINNSSMRDSTDTLGSVKPNSRPSSSKQPKNANAQSPTAVNTPRDDNVTVDMEVEPAASQNIQAANEIDTSTASLSQPNKSSENHTTTTFSHQSDASRENQDLVYLVQRLPEVPNDVSASTYRTDALNLDNNEEEESPNLVNESVPTHPKCQFQTDKPWLDRQFHSDKSIKKPDELEKEMNEPPLDAQIDNEILNRIQGSMIGMALGDALGAHVEFRPRQYLLEHPVTHLEAGGTWGLKAGQFTDDTSMALCLANSLVARRDFIPYDQLLRYKWWYKDGYMSSTGRCFDIGAATSQSLREFDSRQRQFVDEHDIPLGQLEFLSDVHLLEEFKVFCSEEGVAGNGALMRLAPVPLFFYNHPIQAVEFSGRSGEITHGDRSAYDACRYYGALIVAAMRGETKDKLLDNDFYSKHKVWFNSTPLHPEIMKIARGSYKKRGGYDEGIRGKGYIVNALEAALWAFWAHEDSFADGALAAVNLGDDTDTTAAIYGQLAGAYYGYDKLPSDWVDQVYAKDFIKTLSKWIAYEGQRWKPVGDLQTESKSGQGHHASNS